MNIERRKTAFILRGLTGSGKSTVAQRIARIPDYGYVRIHSTEDYFYTERGTYRYDSRRAPLFEQFNFHSFVNSLEQRYTAICDSTNARLSDYERYVAAAKDHGYWVRIIVMPHPDIAVAAMRGTHGVPRKTLARTLNEWETDPREEKYVHGFMF